MLVWYAIILIKKNPIFDVLSIPPLLFLFCRMEIGMQKKINDPSKMIAECYAAPQFQLHKKV